MFFIKSITKVLNKLKINKDTPLIVSVSGGVDSMVLFNLLVKFEYKIIVVHFNHHTRDENLLEKKLVEDTAKSNNITYYTFDYNHNGGNFQEQARKFRLKKLREVAKKHNTTYVLTAHHLDDLAETIILKIVRGSNLYGYAGIQPVTKIDSFTYIKPLIELSKKEIITYANKNDVKYLDDASNFDIKYARNRIRNAVLPILKQENDQVLNKFLQYSELLTESYNFIKKYSYQFILDNKIDISNLIKEDNIIIKETLAILLEQNKLKFNQNTLNKLINILKSKKPNLKYNLSNNYKFIKSYNQAYIQKNVETKPFRIELKNGINMLPNMKKITLLNNVSDSKGLASKICYNEISLPLIARTRIPGDVLMFNYGRKKLKDFLIDKKIPLNKRDDLVVITDSNNIILWVEGCYTNNTIGQQNTIYIELGENHES